MTKRVAAESWKADIGIKAPDAMALLLQLLSRCGEPVDCLMQRPRQAHSAFDEHLFTLLYVVHALAAHAFPKAFLQDLQQQQQESERRPANRTAARISPDRCSCTFIFSTLIAMRLAL
jgi:hypothetical protein